MNDAQPGADVVVLNGGAVRANLPPGPLTYGRLFEAYPFDNTFASFPLAAGRLRRRLAWALDRGRTQPAIAGLRVVGHCAGSRLVVDLFRPDGTPVTDDTRLRVLTTDYLASGGDGLFGRRGEPVTVGPAVRDAVAQAARQRGAPLDPTDPALFDPAHPRVALPRPVPVRCGSPRPSAAGPDSP
jgi:2',3'-cyclic-nucleotide 2'-phosphodiesterase (5'-nucleotidase family)